jgi:hypothetical protein
VAGRARDGRGRAWQNFLVLRGSSSLSRGRTGPMSGVCSRETEKTRRRLACLQDCRIAGLPDRREPSSSVHLRFLIVSCFSSLCLCVSVVQHVFRVDHEPQRHRDTEKRGTADERGRTRMAVGSGDAVISHGPCGMRLPICDCRLPIAD